MINKKNSLGILALLCGLGFMGAAQAAYDQNQGYSSSNYGDNRASSTYGDSDNRLANISDQELSKKISDKIGPGWFSRGYDQVTFQVNNGMVNLQGTVNSLDDKEKVERKVRDIEGVRGSIIQS